MIWLTTMKINKGFHDERERDCEGFVSALIVHVKLTHNVERISHCVIQIGQNRYIYRDSLSKSDYSK